jgi:hypothetical protein
MNGGYTKGFFNFDLGLALMLWALAAWVWLGPERWRMRLVVGTLFSTLLYFVHFYAFAVYGLFLVGLELPRYLPWPGSPSRAERAGGGDAVARSRACVGRGGQLTKSLIG